MSKLPEEICLLVAQQISDDNWNIDRLLQLLSKEVQNREKCTGIQAAAVLPSGNKPLRKQWELMTASALLTGEKNYLTKNCTFCKQHASASCHVITNRATRKQIIFEKRSLFYLLKMKSHFKIL